MEYMRSGLEERIAQELDALGVEYEYEARVLAYDAKTRGAKCHACGSKECYAIRKYTPDFWLPEQGFFIETKGRWTGADRNKHVAVRNSNPNVEIRFIFQYNNWLTSRRKAKYSDWCDKHNYIYAVEHVPEEWFIKNNIPNARIP